jgi:hypothetical protein
MTRYGYNLTLNYQTLIKIQNNQTESNQLCQTNKVIDGMTTESPTLFLHHQLPAVPYFVNSSGPGILIRHRSDFSWDDPKQFKGWLATFEEIVD